MILATSFLACVVLSPSLAALPLRVPEPIVARGDIKGGPPLVQTFDLVHQAPTGLIIITNVEAGCGCLRQHLSASVLQPGETAKLTIEVNTLTQPDGPNRWPVRVRFRREENGITREVGELALLITATLTRELTLTPPQLALSTEGEVRRTLTLTDRRPQPLTLVKAVTSSPHLKAQIQPRRGAETVIALVLGADAPPGLRDESVLLYSDDPAYPEFRVPVRAERRAAAAANVVPDAVVLRLAAGQTETSALVQVRAAAEPSVEVSSVECDHPAVTAKWSQGRGPVATVRLRVTEKRPTANEQVSVRIRLAGPAGETVVLPVAWAAGP